MNRNLIYVVILILGVLIAYLILGDAFRNEITEKQGNPYAYDLGDIRKVDPSMVKYREVKRINVTQENPVAIDYFKGKLAIGYESQLQLIDTLGREYFNLPIQGLLTALSFSPEGNIYVGCTDHVEVYDMEGSRQSSWDAIDTSSYITSIAFKDEWVFIADAGGPLVYRYTRKGNMEMVIDGKGRVDTKHGFIVPSPYFDIGMDPDNQLWVANTGMQYVENYSDQGSLRAFWGKADFSLAGFTGCCNPAHFTILSDGKFVTCEKGLVRIKVYLPSGELDGVVATPDDFVADSDPADLTSDEGNSIYALDITKKMIRKFERKDT